MKNIKFLLIINFICIGLSVVANENSKDQDSVFVQSGRAMVYGQAISDLIQGNLSGLLTWLSIDAFVNGMPYDKNLYLKNAAFATIGVVACKSALRSADSQLDNNRATAICTGFYTALVASAAALESKNSNDTVKLKK